MAFQKEGSCLSSSQKEGAKLNVWLAMISHCDSRSFSWACPFFLLWTLRSALSVPFLETSIYPSLTLLALASHDDQWHLWRTAKVWLDPCRKTCTTPPVSCPSAPALTASQLSTALWNLEWYLYLFFFSLLPLALHLWLFISEPKIAFQIDTTSVWSEMINNVSTK